ASGQAPRQRACARRGFCRQGTGLGGASGLILVTSAAIFAGQVSQYNPIKQDFRVERQPPGLDHLLGTDEFGRDVLSRIIWGAQSSLQAGAAAATIALANGLGRG